MIKITIRRNVRMEKDSERKRKEKNKAKQSKTKQNSEAVSKSIGIKQRSLKIGEESN